MMKFFTVLLIFIAAIVSINRAIAHSEDQVTQQEVGLVLNQVQAEEAYAWHQQ